MGSTTINAGGFLVPGSIVPGSIVPGTMTVAGNLALQSGAFYVVQVNPTTASTTNVSGILYCNMPTVTRRGYEARDWLHPGWRLLGLAVSSSAACVRRASSCRPRLRREPRSCARSSLSLSGYHIGRQRGPDTGSKLVCKAQERFACNRPGFHRSELPA